MLLRGGNDARINLAAGLSVGAGLVFGAWPIRLALARARGGAGMDCGGVKHRDRGSVRSSERALRHGDRPGEGSGGRSGPPCIERRHVDRPADLLPTRLQRRGEVAMVIGYAAGPLALKAAQTLGEASEHELVSGTRECNQGDLLGAPPAWFQVDLPEASDHYGQHDRYPSRISGTRPYALHAPRQRA